MIRSIFQQEYTHYRVYYFVMNEDDGKKGLLYLEDNAMDPLKLEIIQSDSVSPVFENFLSGQQKCEK